MNNIKQNSIAWLFDIDGVLTTPQTKKVSLQIVEIISKILETDPVAFVTGRSILWIKDNLMPLVNKNSNAQKDLERLFLSGEKGGVWEYFDQGQWKHFVKKELSLPEKFKNECKNLIEQKYGQYVFWDPKETMVSVEMKSTLGLKEFKEIQEQIDHDLRGVIDASGLDGLEMDSGLIATDIQSQIAGKDLAASSVVDFLRYKHFFPQRFLTFGDSATDISMASHLSDKGYKVDFIFTGEDSFLGDRRYDFPIEVISGYEQGTLAYLRRMFKLD